jgi:4-hydroxybenzoate polyprenyltransferase
MNLYERSERAEVSVPSPRRHARWALRLEGAAWLTRPQTVFSQVPIALAAWSIGTGGLATSSAGSVAILILFLASFQAAMFVVNDIYDATRDKVSAPYMPLPSGVVSRLGAMVEAGVLGAVFLGCIIALSQDLVAIAAVLITIPLALATMKLYGMTKSAWFSPLLGSSTFASAALWAWLMAGRGHPAAFFTLFVAAALHGVHANVRAQLRDIEGDPKAGVATMASRLGPKWTTWLAALVRGLELGAIVVLVVNHGVRLGWLWLAPAFGLFALAVAHMGNVYAEIRNRVDQTQALTDWVYVSFMAEIAMLGAVEPVIAAPVTVLMFAWFKVVRRLYYHRLVGGHLAADLHALPQRATA